MSKISKMRRTGVKLKAASLLEVVIAMVIISIVFGVGMMTYMNILKSSFSVQQLNATLLLNKIVEETKQEQSFFDETITEENITVYKKASKYQGNDNLVLLELEVLDAENKILANRKQLIRTEAE
jgi:Tfp pilus assembly protein PilV